MRLFIFFSNVHTRSFNTYSLEHDGEAKENAMAEVRPNSHCFPEQFHRESVYDPIPDRTSISLSTLQPSCTFRLANVRGNVVPCSPTVFRCEYAPNAIRAGRRRNESRWKHRREGEEGKRNHGERGDTRLFSKTCLTANWFCFITF